MQSLNDRIKAVTMQSMAIIEKKLIENPDPEYAMQVLAMLRKDGVSGKLKGTA
jgi:hypothetical protein